MEIGLFYNNSNNRSGPGKLAGNLTKGLSLAGVACSQQTSTPFPSLPSLVQT